MPSPIYRFRIPPKLLRELKKAGKKEDGGPSAIVRRALAKELGLWSADKGIIA